MTTNLAQYLPFMYDDVTETSEIMSTENDEFDCLFDLLDEAQANQFIQTCNVKGIAYFEYILELKVDIVNDTIQDRRNRVMVAWSTRTPFTMPFLRTKLNEMFGVGNWEAHIVADDFELHVNVPADDAVMIDSLYKLITKIKPCNMLLLSDQTMTNNDQVPKFGSYNQYQFKVVYPSGD